jgi:hypothetical protein
MVPLGAWVAGIPVHPRDAVGAALVGVGPVGFLLALRPSEDAGQGATAGWIATALVGALAVEAVRQVKGLGPFAAELVVVRGAPDALPRNERRLEAEVAERYGSSASLEAVADTWRPLRSWAAVHLRVLRE